MKFPHSEFCLRALLLILTQSTLTHCSTLWTLLRDNAANPTAELQRVVLPGLSLTFFSFYLGTFISVPLDSLTRPRP
jgi:hypothetical protein